MPFRALSNAVLAGALLALPATAPLRAETAPVRAPAAIGPATTALATLAGMPAEALRRHAPGTPREGVTLDAAWLAAQPEAGGDAQWECLARAIYFEARGETLAGQVAVAEVVLNRTDSPAYPRTVCAVVGQRGGGGCQFSHVCDGAPDVMADPEARRTAGKIAAAMLAGAPRRLTGGATHFHALSVRPGWAGRFPRTATIGAHVFYRAPGPVVLAAAD